MFSQAASHGGEASQSAATTPQASAAPESMAGDAPDTTVYRPWLVQRWWAHPVVTLGLRR